MIEDATGKLRQEEKSDKQSVPRQRRSRSNGLLITSMSVLEETLIQALTDLGGSSHCSKIIERMEELLEGKFLPGDLELCSDGKELVWHNRTRWERQNLEAV
jgi:hypothetical protein